MITLYNNDCFEQIKTIDDNSIDLIIADPPYGISFNGVTSDTSWDNIEDYKAFITDFLIEVKRVLSDNGVCWLFCARTKIPEVFESINAVGMHNNLKYWCTYARQKGRGSKNYPKSVAEEVLHVSKSAEFYYSNIEYLRDVVAPYVKNGKPRGWFVDINTGQRVRWTGLGNVLSFSAPYYKHKFEKQIHSTQKPFLLMCALITTSSKIGDTILDPFMGSGVTGIACDVLDRNFIGIEKDKDMFDKASNWINNYSKSLASEYINNRLNYPDKIDLWGEA